MKVLNAYAGIGGNRKLWPADLEITAVELDPQIAKIYQDFWPNDKVIVTDAHQYILDHFHEFDFIWSSPPCPTHSRLNISFINNPHHSLKYPQMELYQEIIFLQQFFKGKYCIENVISYYKPLIKPQEVNNHYFWTNFNITKLPIKTRNHNDGIKILTIRKGLDISKYSGIDKEKILRNCIEPELGKHIFDCAFKGYKKITDWGVI